MKGLDWIHFICLALNKIYRKIRFNYFLLLIYGVDREIMLD